MSSCVAGLGPAVTTALRHAVAGSPERSHLHSFKQLSAGHRDRETLGGHPAVQACLVLWTCIDVAVVAHSRQRPSSSKRLQLASLPRSGPDPAVSPRRVRTPAPHAPGPVRPLTSPSHTSAPGASSLTALERQLAPRPFPSHPGAEET